MATSPDPYNEYIDSIKGRSRSSTERMIEALMAKAGQPNPSLGGALGHSLALGLMGLYERRDKDEAEGKALDVSKAGLPMPAATAPPTSLSPPPAPYTGPSRIKMDDPVGPPVMASALRNEGPSEMDMAANDVADSLKAEGMPVSPGAVRQLALAESRGNPRAQKGSYYGATQMGEKTFEEAGGRIGGITYPEYKQGSLTQQMWAYPDWLKQYNVPQKLDQAGVDIGNQPPATQYGIMQAAQFAPNDTRWINAAGKGNFNVPSTRTPQATALGDKSVAAMAESPYGQRANAEPGQPQTRMAQIEAAEDKRIQTWIQQGQQYEAQGDKRKAAAFYNAARQLDNQRQDRQLQLQNQLELKRQSIPITLDEKKRLGPIEADNAGRTTTAQESARLPFKYNDESQKLRKEVSDLPSYKNLAQAAPIYKTMLETAGHDSKASDLNLVYGLGKIFDPNSVVREGEMVMVKNTASLPDWLIGGINSLNGGARLTPETRAAILREAHSRITAYKGLFDQDSKMYRGISDRAGYNQADIIPDFGDFPQWQQPGNQPPQQVQQPPSEFKPGADWQFSPSREQYRDPQGNVYDKSGRRINGR